MYKKERISFGASFTTPSVGGIYSDGKRVSRRIRQSNIISPETGEPLPDYFIGDYQEKKEVSVDHKSGPASGYELNQDLKEKSDSNAAEQRRLFVKQLQMPTVASLSETFLKGYPNEHINFIWWLSRSRPGQIKKLKDSLQSIDKLNEHNYIQFLSENKVLNEPLDDVGESNVTFLKTELFEGLSINLKDLIKNLLINYSLQEISHIQAFSHNYLVIKLFK